MKALSTLVKAVGARRGLEIGGGIGYSALWLADAMGLAGQLETIDRDAEHVALIDRYAQQFGLAGRLLAIHGEATDALQKLTGPYDVIHDDGWFGEQPDYFERMIDLLRPGGLLILANFFLLEQAITGELTEDWTRWAGPHWAENVQSYARALALDERLDVSFILRPSWVGLAYKRPDA
jgi:predicted O-methyltransferase YrrM